MQQEVSRVVPCPRCGSVEGRFVLAQNATCHCKCGYVFRIGHDLQIKQVVALGQKSSRVA